MQGRILADKGALPLSYGLANGYCVCLANFYKEHVSFFLLIEK